MNRQRQGQGSVRAVVQPGDIRAARKRRLWTGRIVAIVFSVGGHLLILLSMLTLGSEPPQPVLAPDEGIKVALVSDQRPPGANAEPEKPPAPKPAPKKKKLTPVPTRTIARISPAPRDVERFEASEAPSGEAEVELSDADIAGAQTAGSGPPGRACDMVQLLQSELRKDPQVQVAVARARSRGEGAKAFHVWNGDWITSRGEEGKGLAGVREAIMVKVAFAPEACRKDPMRGLIMISLNDAPGSARLAIGGGSWRWSDLLFPR
jgi:hypothetical protein